MGWLKEDRISEIAAQAKQAISEGRRVFVCRLNKGTWERSSSGSLPAVAELIETVEALGWTLDRVDFNETEKSSTVFLIFRLSRQEAFLPRQSR